MGKIGEFGQSQNHRVQFHYKKQAATQITSYRLHYTPFQMIHIIADYVPPKGIYIVSGSITNSQANSFTNILPSHSKISHAQFRYCVFPNMC